MPGWQPRQPHLMHWKRKPLWWVAAGAALTMSFVGLQAASYSEIPGVRGHELTIQLTDPVPMFAQASEGQMPDSASLDAPVPMPLPVDAAGNPLPAAPVTPEFPAKPFSLSGRFDPGPAAAPYVFASRSATDTLRAAVCLTTAIYYEAASETDDGQRAVAQVILNRVRHANWPNTVCGVVYQASDMPGCQFSYACDGSMARVPTREGWARASRIARAALAGYVYAPVGLATYYHTPQVNPAWNRRLSITAVIGNHIFYRMPGSTGTPRAFGDVYAGGEPVPGPLPRRAPWPAPALATAAFDATAIPAAPYPAAQVAAPAPAAQTAQRTPEDNRYVQGALPDSNIRPEYRNSGEWIRR